MFHVYTWIVHLSYFETYMYTIILFNKAGPSSMASMVLALPVLSSGQNYNSKVVS